MLYLLDYESPTLRMAHAGDSRSATKNTHMKKITYFLMAATMSTLMACGGGANQDAAHDDANNAEQAPDLTGFEQYDLGPHDMELTIMIPGGGSPDAMANDWGGVDLALGESFMISIANGEGDMELLKADLNDDLVYTATIVEEGADYLIYSRVIADTEMKPEFHFFLKKDFNGDIYEVSNMKDEVFGEGAVRNMLKSAQTLAQKTAG